MTRGSEDGHWDLIPNWVSEALAFHTDGRPLGRVRSGRPPEATVDPLAPVVVAFQGMIQDGLGERGRPVSAVYGERILSLVPGRRVHVATVARGQPDPELRRSMEDAVTRIEADWGPRIDAWTGVPSELEELVRDLAPVVGRTADRGPGEVAEPLNVRGIHPVSAVDFEGGRARLKVTIFSSGFLAVRGGYLELTFNRESLRLEGSEPAHALTAEGTVKVATISPGEATTVACLLEPLGPGKYLLESTITFFDDANNPRHLEVPPREAHVLFPDLGMDAPGDGPWEGLDSATRSWRYPASLGGIDVMRTVRTVMGTRGLVLSAGEEEVGPPPQWTVVGRAVADRSPLSASIRVTGGDVRRIEMVVASTKAAATAGAVAEMRGLLEGEFFRRWRGQVVLEEEGVKRVAKVAAPVPTDIDNFISLR
jgi:hypothetical protein